MIDIHNKFNLHMNQMKHGDVDKKKSLSIYIICYAYKTINYHQNWWKYDKNLSMSLY